MTDREMKEFELKLNNLPDSDYKFIDACHEVLYNNKLDIDKDELVIMMAECSEKSRELFRARLERMCEDIINGEYATNIAKDKDYYLKAGSDRIEVEELINDRP